MHGERCPLAHAWQRLVYNVHRVSPDVNNLVRYGIQNNIAVITIDNPPVNALSPGVPEGIEECIDRATRDEVNGVVVIGAGRTFVAGADISALQELALGLTTKGPELHELFQKIEDTRKPVVMAIHGTALGGGLELAQAGHYRVAAASAQFGQPEVNLGLIPGAEGTQRLPRLVGVEKALELCVTGKFIHASEALSCGLIDAVVEGELLAGAIDFARTAKVPVRTRDRNQLLGTPEENGPLFGAARELATKSRPRQWAPMKAIDAIEAATKLSFDEGCEFERDLFMNLIKGDQAKALMHLFFAERAAGKVRGVGKDTPTIPISRVGVVGAGTMGTGITMCFVNAGIPVVLREVNSSALESGMTRIRESYATGVKRGRITEKEAERRLRLIQPQTSVDGFESLDMVVEAVFEDTALKKQVFKELDAATKASCILASNTSSLNIDEIASVTSRPEAVIGTHFFSPANLMRLLEIVRGKQTSPATVATAMWLAKQFKKVGVVVGNCEGFVGNRMFFPYVYEAQFLIEDGATPQQVDRALTDFGMAMGVFAVDDLAGIDVGWRIKQEMNQFAQPGVRRPLVADQLYALGRYGQKTQKGWYRYDENRKPVPDHEVLALIDSAREAAGIAPRNISDNEIVERTIYSLINEGARTLEAGFAARASDIDVIYTNGYGFPVWRGGPMCFADLTGLDKIASKIEEFHASLGERWAIAPLLKKLAAEGRTFSDYDKRTE